MVVQPRFLFLQRVRVRSVRRLSVEQRDEQTFVQFGADKGEPLLQPRPFEVVGRRKLGVRISGGDVLQDRSILPQQRTIIKPHQRDQFERIKFAIVVAVERPLGLGVDFDEPDVGAGLWGATIRLANEQAIGEK